jgi:hypothetical protein
MKAGSVSNHLPETYLYNQTDSPSYAHNQGSMFIQNVSIHLKEYTVSQSE